MQLGKTIQKLDIKTATNNDESRKSEKCNFYTRVNTHTLQEGNIRAAAQLETTQPPPSKHTLWCTSMHISGDTGERPLSFPLSS